jgi:hypothetical protein
MDLNAAIAENQGRVNDFIAVAKSVGGMWNAPVRPEKWSPAQVSEHIHIAYLESTDVVNGVAQRFPKFPGLLRWVARMMAFDQVMKTGGKFRPVKTFKDFNPSNIPANPDEAAARIRAASAAFEQAIRGVNASAVNHPLFGKLALPEYVRFQGYHTLHHQAQLST